MSAAEALKAARTAGIEIRLDDDDLVLEASSAPPAAVLDLLSRHKPGIAVLLRSGRDGSAEDWQVFFDERAGIAEFDGDLSRTQAEAHAFACCIADWHGQTVLHSRCRPDWRAGRIAEAVAALMAIGVAMPAEFPDDFGKIGDA